MSDDVIERAKRMLRDAQDGARMAHEKGEHKIGARLEGAAEVIEELLRLLGAQKDG